MRSDAVVQHDDGTPTGSRSTSFFIRGILGPDAWSIFVRWLRRLAERFSVAASLVGDPGDGWRFRPGCSIGRLARPGVLAPPPTAHRHPHSNARQFDLFCEPPDAAAQTPQWQALPAETRHTLTKLMVRLIFGHADGDLARGREEMRHDV